MHVEDIYAALTDDEALARLPRLLAELTNARSALIHWRHPDGDAQVLAHSYFTDAQIRDFTDRFAAKSLWHQACLPPDRINRIWNIGQLVGEKAFAKSEIFNEWIRPGGDDTFYCIGGVFETPCGRGALAVHRGRTQPDFGDRELAALRPFTTHLQRMLSVRCELAAGRRQFATYRSSLDTLGYAVLQIRAGGCVVALNEAAETILRRADGLMLRDGCLVASDRDSAMRLTAAIAAATASREPCITAALIARDCGTPLQATLTPLVGEGGAARALMVLREPGFRDVSMAPRLRALFGLSVSEADIAVALAEGLSLKEIAIQREVSEGTVRGQIKLLMAKMGVHRQAELVSVVLRLPPLRRGCIDQ